MKGKIIPKEYEILNIQSPGIETDYYITFRINNKCNIKCDYCHWRNGDNYNYKDIIKTIDNIINFCNINGLKKITFYFHGGEPSFHPNIKDILKYIKGCEKKNIKIIIEFQTNLSLSNYKEFDKYIDFYNISFHYNELKRNNLIHNFFKNLENIDKKLLNLDIMLENIDLKNIEEFYKYLEKLYSYSFINSEMIYGFCHYDKNNITEQLHKKIYKKYNKTEQLYKINNIIYNTNDLFTFGINCKGMKCSAGKNTIVINGDGNLFICGIHMTNNINNNSFIKPFTNIIKDNNYLFKWKYLLKNGYICKWEYCGGDFYLERER